MIDAIIYIAIIKISRYWIIKIYNILDGLKENLLKIQDGIQSFGVKKKKKEARVKGNNKETYKVVTRGSIYTCKNRIGNYYLRYYITVLQLFSRQLFPRKSLGYEGKEEEKKKRIDRLTCYSQRNLIHRIYIFCFQDKLLTKLEKNEPELASSQEDEVSKRFLAITLKIDRRLVGFSVELASLESDISIG